MKNKNKVKSLFDREMENAQFRKLFDEEYGAFKLEVQILNALEKKDWSYAALADAVGTSKSNISRDLKGGGLISASLSRIHKMADALGMRLLTLLIPREQEDFVLPRIEALVQASFTNEEVKINESSVNAIPQMTDPLNQFKISTAVTTEAIFLKNPVINAGSGSNYVIIQDNTKQTWESVLASATMSEYEYPVGLVQ